MAFNPVALSATDARRLSRVITKSERLAGQSRFNGAAGHRRTNEGTILVQAPEEGIPGFAGNVLGSAECILFQVDAITGQFSKYDDGSGEDVKVTVFNLNSKTIVPGSLAFAIKNRSGLFCIERIPTVGLTGLVRVKFEEDFFKHTDLVNCKVERSDLEVPTTGDSIEADNAINLESDKNNAGFVYVYQDIIGGVKYEIVNAECPAD